MFICLFVCIYSQLMVVVGSVVRLLVDSEKEVLVVRGEMIIQIQVVDLVEDEEGEVGLVDLAVDLVVEVGLEDKMMGVALSKMDLIMIATLVGLAVEEEGVEGVDLVVEEEGEDLTNKKMRMVVVMVVAFVVDVVVVEEVDLVVEEGEVLEAVMMKNQQKMMETVVVEKGLAVVEVVVVLVVAMMVMMRADREVGSEGVVVDNTAVETVKALIMIMLVSSCYIFYSLLVLITIYSC